MTIKRNSTIFGKHHLSRTIIAALFSVTLIFGMGGVSLPLQPQQEVYASSQMQAPPPTQTTPSSQVPPLPRPTPICNPNSPTLQFGSTGAKVVEIQRILTQIGYGPLLGQSGIDGKFATSTQNAVKKFQQDNRLPVDGKIGPISWRALCTLITSVAPSPSSEPIQTLAQNTPPQISPSTDCNPAKSEQAYPVKVYKKGIWAFIYTIYKGQGLVLKTLLADSNTLLDSISVPHFKIEYGGKSKIIRFCNEMSSEPKIITETNRVGGKYDRLTWGFTKVFNEPDLRGNLNINYHIIIKTSRSICEKGAEAECYRFIPIVSFSWTRLPFQGSCSVEHLLTCPIGQRIPEKLDKFTAFYKLDYGKTTGLTLTSDYNNLPAAVLLNLGPQAILKSETGFRAVTDGGEGAYDNMHNAHVSQGVSIPACRETKFDCLHMHWRWTDARDPRQRTPLDPLVDTISDLQVPKHLSGTAYFVPGQTIDIAIVKDHSDKAYEAFPNDPARLVDGEPIASTHGPKVPGMPSAQNAPWLLTASYHPVMWYVASVKNTNAAEFFRHGMFVLDTT